MEYEGGGRADDGGGWGPGRAKWWEKGAEFVGAKRGREVLNVKYPRPKVGKERRVEVVSPRTPFFFFWCPYARCGCRRERGRAETLDNSCQRGSSPMWTPTRCRTCFCFWNLNGPPSSSPDLPQLTPRADPILTPEKNSQSVVDDYARPTSFHFVIVRSDDA
jgi:hypothetical protein